MSRRRFGWVRRLPSGRWQASFVGPNGKRQTANRTFPTKRDAGRWLDSVEVDLARGTWVDDELGRQTFGEYAKEWLRDNPRVGPRWRETCERNLRIHLRPLLAVPLRAITASTVRSWHAQAVRGSGGKTSIAQSYRLLRAVMNAAVREGAISKNPCQIPGAGSDRARQRTVATPAQVAALAEAIAPPYKVAVLLAAWGGLRRGEILGLHRDDVDLDAGIVTIRRSQTELLATRARFDSKPKTDAAYRSVALPAHVVAALKDHMDEHAGPDRVFVARDGGPMRGDTLRQAFVRARRKVGMDDFRFHDLRHTGQTLAAATGATLADLMRRLGHSSPAAANRYLHAVSGRDEAIAEALALLAEHGDAAKLPKAVTIR
jgi:integrase